MKKSNNPQGMTLKGLNKKFVMFLLIGILLVSFSSAYMRSNVQYASSGPGSGGQWQPDRAMCEAGQDFVIQIAPFGCTPAVVRADLLEEQNVPVFCQLGATKINPLIKVEAIESMRFSGKYPAEVSGIGFHPAKAALGVEGDLNSPILNNIGYAVIILKKQPNASAMPEFVTGNLTAEIKYDIQNAYGIGKASFYLPEMSDDDWDKKHEQYGFWQGRGYLRAEGIDTEGARISVYDDTRKISSVDLSPRDDSGEPDKGKSSNMIYLPGFDCLAGFKLKLEGLEVPDTRAKLNINGEIVEVAVKENFLENRCWVKDIDKKGLVQEVEVYCKGDEERGSFDLRISPKVELEICDGTGKDCETKDYEAGDKLPYEFNDHLEKNVYLGFIGTEGNANKKEDLYVRFVQAPYHENKLSDGMLSDVANFDKGGWGSQEGGILAKLSKFIIKAPVKLVERFARYLVQGSEISMKLKYGNGHDSTYYLIDNVYGKNIKIIGFAGAVDKELGEGESNIIYYDVIDGEIYGGNYPNGLELISNKIKECSDVDYDVGEDDCTEYLDYGEFGENGIFKKRVNSITPSNSYKEFFENFESAKISNDKKRISVSLSGNEKVGEFNEIKEYYKSATESYDTILKSFPSEKYIDETEGFDEITFGEEALYKKILLAEKTGQKKTVVDLCKEFKNQYPDSKKILKEQCNSEYKLSSSEIASRDVSINGIVKRISLEGIYEPNWEEYSAEITITNAGDDCSGGVVLQKNKEACFSDSEFIILKELHEDYALFDVSSVNEGLLKNVAWKTSYLKIELNVPKVIGVNNYQIKLNKINLKKSAKVSVNPNIKNAGTEANFSFKIGIEQRAIKLSPEKTREKIEQLNETIAKWEERSEQLGKVVQGLKASCLATGTFLTVKNFFTNTGGKSIARQEVMKEINIMCADAINTGYFNGKKVDYKTPNECFTKEYKYIDGAVDDYYKILEEKNKEFENLQEGITETDWLGERTINDKELAKKVFTKTNKDELIETLKKNGINEIEIDGVKKPVSEIVNMINENTSSVTSFRDLEVMATASGSASLKEMAGKKIEQELTDIYRSNKERAEREAREKEMQGDPNLKDVAYTVVKGEKSIVIPYERGIVKEGGVYGHIQGGALIKKINIYGKDYIVELGNKDSKGEYGVKNVYDESGILVSEPLIEDDDFDMDMEDYENLVYDSNVEKIKNNLMFKTYDASTYQNTYKSSLGEKTPCLRYYETEPYKGLPGIVPFDLKEGWYASVGQTLPVFGGISSYAESGRVTSFYVCNVGPNNIEENKAGDDICRGVDTGTGASSDVFPGLDSGKASSVIRKAKDAIEEASRIKTRTSGKNVRINGQSVRICKPAVDVPEMQCQNFMSPKECQWLFNVCDPVICPSSRCDYGGTYPVKDVIQSGIIGSILLCLPNIREGIYVPVCLTGIKAGIDGLLSVYTSYRDCLQESLDTGKMVGICDEIYSIHLCEFFWRQSLPLAKMIIPKTMEWILGQNVRGGGEYLGVASAWANAEQSIDYFMQYYAASSYEAFKGRVAEGIGDAVCKNSISGVYPEGGDLLDSLTEPDSPPQFHGRFDEITFTTATNPPISHYKVFYHIYAGKESRAYYQVYLKSPPGSSFYQDTSTERIVASGYIATGGYATETKDFTAPSGYKELCIVVNGQEECGFKEVSTSYAVNYVQDKYMEEQASEKDIKTEKECIGGSVSAYSLLSPSLEGAADELINPAIYNRGIIRICATENPGKGTDGKYGTKNERWVDVGNCGVENIKCWLDRESVKNVIKHTDIENRTLEDHTNGQLDLLRESGDYFEEGEFETLVKDVKKLIEDKQFEEAVSKLSEDVMKKAFLNKEKAELLLLRGNAFKGLVDIIIMEQQASVEESPKTTTGTGSESGGKGEGEVSGNGGEGSSGGGEVCTKHLCIPATSITEELNIMGGSCHIKIGKKIMDIAKKYKTGEDKFKDEQFEIVGAKNFECLVLQLAMQESCLSHCKYKKGETSYNYCNNIDNNVVKGDGGHSIGVMQLSDGNFDEIKALDFRWNVEEGVKHLIDKYRINLEIYKCHRNSVGEKESVVYSGWQKALRGYNGWNDVCYRVNNEGKKVWVGDPNYVENVKVKSSEIKDLFPECQ